MSAAAHAQPRKFDPARETHYAISEWSEYQLRRCSEAAMALGTILDSLDEDKDGIADVDLGAVFHALAFAIESSIEERALIFPRQPQ